MITSSSKLGSSVLAMEKNDLARPRRNFGFISSSTPKGTTLGLQKLRLKKESLSSTDFELFLQDFLKQ